MPPSARRRKPAFAGRRMRIGLVLGGGGVRGAAWMMGALHGLVDETGWDPATADVVVGTSAGAIVAALAMAGAQPWDILASGRQDFFEALMAAAAFRLEPTLRSLGPGSLTLARRALRAGPGHLMQVVAGLLPRGIVSVAPIVRLIRERVPAGWPAGQRLWITATDYLTGEEITFGRAGAPPAELAAAVAASCAIPGFYRPVEIGGREYVDGGLNSGANLALAAAAGLDLVICADALSSPPRNARGLAWGFRALLHHQLMRHARAVERAGSSLVVLEPAAGSARLIGLNPLSRRRTVEVGRAAAEEVRRYLRQPAVRRKLGTLGARGPGSVA